MRTTIKDFYNKILGYVEEKPNGDKTFYDFYNRIVAYYIKSTNTTLDFYKRIIGRGDIGVGLLYNK